MPSLLIADEMVLVREGLASLCTASGRFHVTAQCSDGEQALALIVKLRPDLAILDYDLPKLHISEVSSPGESHPEALAEPYLNVSAHTAPIMEPRRTPSCQCAHNFGSRLDIRATQCVALRKCPRSFLYFRLAQRTNDRSS